MDHLVTAHYTVPGLADRILDAAGDVGVDTLAPVDEFHIRGRAATEELADWAGIRRGDRVLDVGCGIGGSSRYLASRFDCDVTGVDLTAEFCEVATLLSERVGLKTRFRRASALALPFDGSSFDVAWTQHVQMNIADKARFYREIRRVLKPGGTFAFHDVFAGNGAEVLYPVPWAAEPSISHLADVDAISWAGFERVRWEDKTAESTAFFEQALSRPPSALGLHLLQSRGSFENVLDNLQRGAIRVVMAVLRKQ